MTGLRISRRARVDLGETCFVGEMVRVVHGARNIPELFLDKNDLE